MYDLKIEKMIAKGVSEDFFLKRRKTVHELQCRFKFPGY